MESCIGCPHHQVYDWHYDYCSAHTDEKPSLRPGGGKQIHSRLTPPPQDCPLNVKENASGR
jgi:hypothetical protein